MMRTISRIVWVSLASLSFACGAQEPEPAPAPSFIEGQDYALATQPKPVADPDKVLVEEIFGYWCPHCAEFDPQLTSWLLTQPADVDFQRVPVTFGNARAQVLSEAYFAAQQLKLLDKVHPAIFAALHERRVPINTPEQMAALFNQAAGVLPEVALSAINSFPVDSQVRRADLLASGYGVRGVPTMVVGGKYVVSSGQNMPYGRMLACVDFLIQKVRAEQTP